MEKKHISGGTFDSANFGNMLHMAHGYLNGVYGIPSSVVVNPNTPHIPQRSGCYHWMYHGNDPEIKKVIFNDMATIVLWNDNTKTVVKMQNGDRYDKEKGLAMAISKKFLGNKGSYYDVFKKWLSVDDWRPENLIFKSDENYPNISKKKKKEKK